LVGSAQLVPLCPDLCTMEKPAMQQQ
jgi:hypothetical protein